MASLKTNALPVGQSLLPTDEFIGNIDDNDGSLAGDTSRTSIDILRVFMEGAITTLNSSGDITANAFIGDGSALTGITGATGGISNLVNTNLVADSDNNGSGLIDFSIGPSSAMQVLNNGNISIVNSLGIGTTSPLATLDISQAAANTNNRLRFGYGPAPTTHYAEIYLDPTGATEGLKFELAAADEYFAFLGGNVGIGTASPGKALEVAGGATSGNGVLVTGSSSPQIRVEEATGTIGNIQVDSAAVYVSAVSNHPLILRSNNTEYARITTSGNVGIATTSPYDPLTVGASTERRANLASFGYFAGSNHNVALYLGTGTSAKGSLIHFTDSVNWNWLVGGSEDTAGDFIWNAGGHGGGAGTQRMTLTQAGVVTMGVYGAGTATFSATGVISSVSDRKSKVDDGELTVEQAYKTLDSTDPRFFFMKDSDGAALKDERHLGFYAQEVAKELPEAAPHSYMEDDNGKVIKDTWGIYDRSMIAMHHVVIKDLKKRIEELEAA